MLLSNTLYKLIKSNSHITLINIRGFDTPWGKVQLSNIDPYSYTAIYTITNFNNQTCSCESTYLLFLEKYVTHGTYQYKGKTVSVLDQLIKDLNNTLENDKEFVDD